MSDDLNAYDMDVNFLHMEFSKWWKIPSEIQEESFCERVAIMCANNIDENLARKMALEKIIYG